MIVIPISLHWQMANGSPKQTLNLEKKRLMHQLNNSLVGMRRRDEAFSAMTAAKG